MRRSKALSSDKAGQLLPAAQTTEFTSMLAQLSIINEVYFLQSSASGLSDVLQKIKKLNLRTGTT